MGIPFTKAEGLGNDFILVDEGALGPGADPAALARRWCDRRFGVGADGLLVLSEADDAHARMTIYNADGSRPEMCGNGLRCVAAHLSAARGLGARVCVQTDAGPYECQVEIIDGVPHVEVPMGRVRFDPVEVGVERKRVGAGGTLLLDLERGGQVSLHLASTGNPHAICLTGGDPMALATSLGPQVGAHPAFARGVNASWAHVEAPDRVRLVVYERGAGLTLACGTGACAAVGALARLGVVASGVPVTVKLPGGALEITVEPGDEHQSGPVIMRGPARLVFAGVLPDDCASDPSPGGA